MHDGEISPARTLTRAEAALRPGVRLPWIRVAPDAPYFVDETGAPFTPIGHNDAICWDELDGLFRARDLPGVERHLAYLVDHGTTVVRLMMEYAQHRHRYFERPAGAYPTAMVRLWDDLFSICERVGMRILLTPVDTFWTWLHWKRHPYNRANGGPLDHPSRLLLCPETRRLIKARLEFAARRWGGSGALFAWDLWNEIHPAQSQESAECWPEFIHDLSAHVRGIEQALYGRCHPQTVSLFGPELRWRAHMPIEEPIFRHPDLDFASIHIYAEGAIDDPKDTVACAIETGRIVRECLDQITDGRPFFDSEHGPIHSFKDRHRTLPAAFDDEYFRHMQWAHLASGGAGGGMRWPNRKPHVLTAGMREAQKATRAFLPLIDWARFRRRNLNAELVVDREGLAAFGCGDESQAVVWLLRLDALEKDGRVDRSALPVTPEIVVPGLADGTCRITAYDTIEGRVVGAQTARSGEGRLVFRAPPFIGDLAFTVRRIRPLTAPFAAPEPLDGPESVPYTPRLFGPAVHFGADAARRTTRRSDATRSRC